MPPVIQTLGATHPVSATASSPAHHGSVETPDAMASPAGGNSEFLTTRDLIGSTVLGADGGEIAKVADILIDSEGRLSGYMVTFGGYMGAGCCTCAVSAARGALSRTGQGRTIMVFTDLTPDDLQNKRP